MKKLLVMLITITLLTGCKGNEKEIVEEKTTEPTTQIVTAEPKPSTTEPVEETTTTVPVTVEPTFKTTTKQKTVKQTTTKKQTDQTTTASVQTTQATTTAKPTTTTTTTTTTTQAPLTESEVVAAMNSFRSSYPTGTPWDNSNYYAWKGGTYSGGYGCAGFAFMLSDAAFGTRRARKHTDFDSIRVGDVVRYLNDAHSVIVLKREGNIFTVAEGNMNSAVYWDRQISLEEFKESGSYVFTRW